MINLASNEYFKVISPKLLTAKIITLNFKEIRDGKPKAIMSYVKYARGLMARYIIQNRIQQVDDIKSFTEDGYKFNKSESTDTEWTFTRKSIKK